ncbi:hypothetical protein [Lentzea sp. NBRC 102530]|uniref:hypothetical protein n=1 Tax=Lentzea sp. NBRC 102530 TaxID=3032201 RepID=UPI0024A14FF8|nr:hypothetical protein [Lentzea sp. NBRC 102530]GLY50636.1 hypothetical protein Lesp01_42920 [Lentzea sp. NBRC 102530]
MVFQVPPWADSGTGREGISAHTGSPTLYRDGEEDGAGNSVTETIVDTFLLK